MEKGARGESGISLKITIGYGSIARRIARRSEHSGWANYCKKKLVLSTTDVDDLARALREPGGPAAAPPVGVKI